MSKATLWDVFDAAMGTAELVTGEIAKYKIEQDEAELRKFELEQKQKMANFDIELQGKTDFDNFDRYYNEFMDKQEKDLMSRIKTNAGQKAAKQWFDTQRVDNRITVNNVEVALRKNHILNTIEDTAKINNNMYQGMDLYNKNTELYTKAFQDNLINEDQYHNLIDNLGASIVEQRLNSVIDEAAKNCEDLDQMLGYVDSNFNLNDLNLKIYNPVGNGLHVDNKGVFDVAYYKEKGKERATALWNTNVKKIQDDNYSLINGEYCNLLNQIINKDFVGIEEKITECLQYMNNNPGNKFNLKQREELLKKFNSLQAQLGKGNTSSAGTSVAYDKLANDLKERDIEAYITDYQKARASGYTIRAKIMEDWYKNAQENGYQGSKSDFYSENESLSHKVIELLAKKTNMPTKAITFCEAAEGFNTKLNELAKAGKIDSSQVKEFSSDLANFAIDIALDTVWDENVNTEELIKQIDRRFNALTLKTARAYSDAIKNEKQHAKALAETIGEMGEDMVFTDQYGVQTWIPGSKQAIEQTGGLRETGANLIQKIAGVPLEQVQPSYKTTKGGSDMSSEIQYRVGSDIYELKPSKNGKKVDVYKNGENLGNAYDYNIDVVKAARKGLAIRNSKLKDEFISEENKKIDSFVSMPADKGLLGINSLQWNFMTADEKKQIIRDLRQTNIDKYNQYIEKYKNELGL